MKLAEMSTAGAESPREKLYNSRGGARFATFVHLLSTGSRIAKY